jgi:hypothetical protein
MFVSVEETQSAEREEMPWQQAIRDKSILLDARDRRNLLQKAKKALHK